MKGWKQEKFSHQGEFHSFEDVTVVPKPYQKPHPPIRVAVAGADTFSLMGNLGYPIFISANTPMSVLQERLELYRKGHKDGGHSGPEDVVLRIPAYVAETTEKARSEPEASTFHAIRYGATELLRVAASDEVAERMERIANTPYDEILSRRVMYGTPEAVVERLQEYKEELGISGVVLEMNYGGQIPSELVLNSIRLLMEKVAPEFK